VKQLLTPKQVAQAIGVSESSLKRWCDRGLLPIVRTAGGHRRLPIAGVVAFLREGSQRLVRPELLGLPANTGRGPLVTDRAADQLREALVAGDEDVSRQIVLDLYLARHRVSAICDRTIAPAFRRIGSQWESGRTEVYQERRACQITLRILHEIRGVLPAPETSAPVAIGGTPEGDFYVLPTTAVELVLRECGWRATSLGSSLPRATLEAAIRNSRPRLFWLSVSHVRKESELFEQSAVLYEAAAAAGAAMLVGGRALTERLRQHMQYSAHGDDLKHLESFLATLGGVQTSGPGLPP
jgi:excisionase family DNA binding protein